MPPATPCHYWVMSNTATNHACRDRNQFTTYVPFKSHLTELYFKSLGPDVAGVGSVELQIKRNPESQDIHRITLTNVLHVPTFPCNMFAVKAEEYDRGLEFVLANPIFELQVKGEWWGYGRYDGRFWPLELAGGRMCDTTLPEHTHISVQWPVSEESRFTEHVDDEMRALIQIMKGLKKRENRQDMARPEMIISPSALIHDRSYNFEVRSER